MSSKKHLVIVNPASCRGDTEGAIGAIREALLAARLDADIVITEAPGHATQVLQQRGSDYPVVIASGGDGTLHEVLQSLDLDTQQLGVIPLGSGNDWAWAQQWPTPKSSSRKELIDACVQRIAASKVRCLDVGVFRGGDSQQRFHNSIGCGFEAAVNAESHKIRGLRGSKIYLLAAVRCLFRQRRYSITISWSDVGGSHSWQGSVLQLSVGNGPRVGGTFMLFPDARLDDALFDISRISPVSVIGALALLPKTVRGKHTRHRKVQMTRATHLRVTSPDPLPIHIDGEFIGDGLREFECELLPGALQAL